MADETQTTQTTTEQTAALSGGGRTPSAGDPTTSTPDTAQAEKTFTQAEVNELIRLRLERERKGQPTKDELTAFRDWQNSQKTAEQKAADDLKAAQEAQSAAEQKAADLEAIIAAVKAGVPADAAEDVVALAKLKVTETVTLSAAIAEVLKKYPQFGAAPAPAATTGAKINNGGGTSISGVEKRFLEKNPGIKI